MGSDIDLGCRRPVDDGYGQLQIPLRSSIDDRLLTLLNSFQERGDLALIHGPIAEPTLTQEQVRVAYERLAGTYFRKEGLGVYPLDRPLSQEAFDSLTDWARLSLNTDRLLTIEQAHNISQKELTQAACDGDPYKFYRISNSFQYALTKQLGWIDPFDLSWLQVEKLGLDDSGGHDAVYFAALDPLALAGYVSVSGGFYEEGRALIEALGFKLNDPSIRRLVESSVLLEIDIRGYEELLPEHEQEARGLFEVRDANIDSELSSVEIAAPFASLSKVKPLAVVSKAAMRKAA